MTLNKKFTTKSSNLVCVVGLGYVGLPLAILISKKFKTLGYDNNPNRIQELKSQIDNTNEVNLLYVRNNVAKKMI